MKAHKTILLADPHGFCTGVKRAITIAENAITSSPSPIYCLHELVHNKLVVDRLTARGMRFVKDISEVPSGHTVLFSAHGVSPSLRAEAASRNLSIIDATCVFVNKVHEAVRTFAAEGCSILLIGSQKHDEVIGVAGEAPNAVTIVESPNDAANITVPDPEKVAVLTQTTLAAYQTEPIISILKNRFPKLKVPDKSGICLATSVRQEAVRKIAKEASIVLVLGSCNSANSNRLVDVARAEGAEAELIPTIDTMREIIASGRLSSHEVIGLTAGASTPEDVVSNAYNLLTDL